MDETSGRSRPVTQREIAALCGLRQSAVSYALRGDTTHVPPETIARVQAVARELGYQPEATQWARRMVGQRHGSGVINHVIAAFLPSNFYSTPYHLSPFVGMWDVCTAEGYDLLAANLGFFTDPRHAFHSPSVLRGDVDGVIASAHASALLHFIAYLRAQPSFADRPIVVPYHVLDAACSTVSADEADGAYRAARHLLALGHRHLLQLRARDAAYHVEARRDGVCRALAEAGLPPDRHLHAVWLTSGWIVPGQDTAGLPPLGEGAEGLSLPAYLRRHPEITAVLAWNDACAAHVWRLLDDAGLPVPASISLIGHDDTHPVPDATGENALTTLRLPLRQIGEEAARLLIRRITGDEPADRHVRLPITLIERRSTAPRR